MSLLLWLSAEGAALACSCVPPAPPDQSRSAAREALRGVVGIAEVDVLSGFRGQGRGEVVRVRQMLHGRLPKRFRIWRTAFESSASCGVLLEQGTRATVMVREAVGRHAGMGGLTIQNLCGDYLVSDKRYRAMLLQEARRRR